MATQLDTYAHVKEILSTDEVRSGYIILYLTLRLPD